MLRPLGSTCDFLRDVGSILRAHPAMTRAMLGADLSASQRHVIAQRGLVEHRLLSSVLLQSDLLLPACGAPLHFGATLAAIMSKNLAATGAPDQTPAYTSTW